MQNVLRVAKARVSSRARGQEADEKETHLDWMASSPSRVCAMPSLEFELETEVSDEGGGASELMEEPDRLDAARRRSLAFRVARLSTPII